MKNSGVCFLFVLLGVMLFCFPISAWDLPEHLNKVDVNLLRYSLLKHLSPPCPVPTVSPSLKKRFQNLKPDPHPAPDAKSDTGYDAGSSVSFYSNKSGEFVFDTIIKLVTEGADLTPVLKQGGMLQSRYGEFANVDMPASAIEAAARLPQVLAIGATHRPSPLNDTARADTGTATVWDTMGYRGDGVMVGVIDSGIDWTHADFKKGDGQTRIAGIWDHTDNQGPAPAGFDYGSAYTSADINAGVCRQQDEDAAGGHGTHVSGTAAGNGLGTGNGMPAGRFAGVAPDSEIVFCKYGGEQNMVDAVKYCFDVADAHNKPIAINLSQGWVFGPHDGTTLVEQNLNALAGADRPGKVLIFAAANSGGQTIHAHSPGLPASDGENYPYLFIQNYQRQGVQAAGVEIYYSPQQTLTGRFGYLFAGQPFYLTDWVPLGQSTGEQSITQGELAGSSYQVVHKAYANGLNNWNQIQFDVVNPQGNSDYSMFLFFVELDGAGTAINAWHRWRDFGRFINPSDGYPADNWRIDGDDDYTLGYPGSMDNAICVASYVTRTSWTDVNGVTQYQQGAVAGEISSFSSRGPRVDGAQKPDIAAPGEALVSTLASNLNQVSASSIEQDGVHQKMQGTSMSAPVVTGLVALMMQKNPNLTLQQAKDLIRNNARDAGPAGWDPVWGSGRLDMPAVLGAMTGGTPFPTQTPGPSSTPAPPTHTPTPTTPGTSNRLEVSCPDTPLLIPDDWSTVTSQIEISQSFQANSVDVSIDLVHGDPNQLWAELTDNYGNWQMLTNTEQTIQLYPNSEVQGVWTLEITDWSGYGGTLQGWSMVFHGSGVVEPSPTMTPELPTTTPIPSHTLTPVVVEPSHTMTPAQPSPTSVATPIPTETRLPGTYPEDINGDGHIDSLDMILLLRRWRQGPND